MIYLYFHFTCISAFFKMFFKFFGFYVKKGYMYRFAAFINYCIKPSV